MLVSTGSPCALRDRVPKPRAARAPTSWSSRTSLACTAETPPSSPSLASEILRAPAPFISTKTQSNSLHVSAGRALFNSNSHSPIADTSRRAHHAERALRQRSPPREL